MAGRRRRPKGAPLEATAECGGGAFSGAKRIAPDPSRVDPVLTPSEHGGRTARKPPRSQTGRRGPFRAEPAEDELNWVAGE